MKKPRLDQRKALGNNEMKREGGGGHHFFDIFIKHRPDQKGKYLKNIFDFYGWHLHRWSCLVSCQLLPFPSSSSIFPSTNSVVAHCTVCVYIDIKSSSETCWLFLELPALTIVSCPIDRLLDWNLSFSHSSSISFRFLSFSSFLFFLPSFLSFASFCWHLAELLLSLLDDARQHRSQHNGIPSPFGLAPLVVSSVRTRRGGYFFFLKITGSGPCRFDHALNFKMMNGYAFLFVQLFESYLSVRFSAVEKKRRWKRRRRCTCVFGRDEWWKGTRHSISLCWLVMGLVFSFASSMCVHIGIKFERRDAVFQLDCTDSYWKV